MYTKNQNKSGDTKMNTYIISENGEKHGELFTKAEPADAFGDWLDEHGYEGDYGLIEKQEDGSYLAKTSDNEYKLEVVE